MKGSEESPRWQWPQAAFAMHRIEEGLHLHSFGNVKTVLCTVLQFKVESDRHSICARSAPAFPGCLPLASVWPWGHYRPIYLLLPSLSTTVQVSARDCKRLLVVVPCVNRRAPTTLVFRRSARRRRSRDGLEGGTRHSSHPGEALRRS